MPPSNGAPADCRNQFCIGGVSVQLQGMGRQIVALVPALAPFQSDAENADISLQLEWDDSFNRESEHKLFDSGSVWELFPDEAGFRFDFRVPALGAVPYKRLVVDSAFSAGVLHLNRAAFNAYPRVAPLDYPLDELLIMHRLTQEKAIELHGTGIVRPNGEANLFVGHSGAGKSTTTRLWTDIEDVEVLSDDRIIVRRDEAAVETPCGAGASSKREVLRPRDSSASLSNLSAQDDKATKAIRMYGTPWHGEAMYASPNSALLSRIFVLEHGFGNVITPLSPSQAVAELFARSFVPFHRHEYVDSALDFLQELVDSVPVYRYSFEPDQRAVEKILHFHD